MTLQTDYAETAAHIMRGSNIVNVPAPELLRMVEDLRRALEKTPASASQLALDFLRRIASSDTNSPDAVRGGLAPWQKKKLERYLRDKLERSIGLSELAGAINLSVSHFCRAFKKSFGATPHAYVLRRRLELAQTLMLTTDDPLSQIALSCGLADQAHLSKLFRRTFHDTPNAWRRRNLTDVQIGTRVRNARVAMRRAA